MLSVGCLSAPNSIRVSKWAWTVALFGRPVFIKHNQHIRVVMLSVPSSVRVAQCVVPLELADTKLSSIVKDG